MSKFERTACCPKCGSVNLKVTPMFASINYRCSECNEYVTTVNYEEYETLKDHCEKCNNNAFKVKVTVDENVETWTPSCSRCNEKPSNKYIDKEGNEIDSAARELLIIKDAVRELIGSAEAVNLVINYADNTLCSLEEGAEYEEGEVFYLLKKQIENCKERASSINNIALKLGSIFKIIEK